MARRKQKNDAEEVTEDEEDNDMAFNDTDEIVDASNDLNEIETMPETAPEPTEVDSNAADTPNNNDGMLPRSASRYVPPLR